VTSLRLFYCINHGTLLSKLSYYGITGIFYSLIKSYSEDRHQRVKLVNNDHKSCSSWGIGKHDEPQGSILGPLLYLLYVNDFIMKITNTKDNNNKSELFLSADDICLIITIPNPTNFIKDINGAFTDINNRFKANSSLNFEKTRLIQFLNKIGHIFPLVLVVTTV
jgi:Reverse transcriptase (RNA-dependent DNA polymerase).